MAGVSDVVARNRVVVSGRAGERTVVLAHGFGCDQGLFRLLAPLLEPHFTVVRFDHVGSGGSDLSEWNTQRYSTMSGYADDLRQVCRAVSPEPVVLVGHSVAAMMGVLAAAAEPALFSGLVLLAPNPCFIDDPESGYRGGFSAGDIEELLELLDSNYLGWSGTMAPVIMGNPQRPELAEELETSFCRTRPDIARAFARVTFLSDNREDLSAVTVPTLVAQCSDDAIAPTEVGEFVHQRIDGSRLTTLTASGHCPQLAAPGETADMIIDFARSL